MEPELELLALLFLVAGVALFFYLVLNNSKKFVKMLDFFRYKPEKELMKEEKAENVEPKEKEKENGSGI